MPESSLNVEMTGRSERFELALAKANAQVDRMKDKLRELGKEGGVTQGHVDRLGGALNQSFGDQAQAAIGGYTARFLSVGAAIGVAASQVHRFIELRDELAAKQAADSALKEVSMAPLALLAGGDQGKLSALKEQAEKLFKGGGAASEAAASQVIYALTAAGVGDQAEFFGKLYPIIKSPEALAKSSAALYTGLGAKETGGIPAIVSKGMAAARRGTGTPEEMLGAAAGAVAPAKMLKWSDEELLSAVALSSKALGGAGEGGGTIEAFGKALAKRGGFAGLGIGGAIEKIQGMTVGESGLLSPEDLKAKAAELKKAGVRPAQIKKQIAELMKSPLVGDEALLTQFLPRGGVKGFEVLKDQQKDLAAVAAEIAAAEREGLAGQVIGTTRKDPELLLPRVARQAAAVQDHIDKRLGYERDVTDALINVVDTEAARLGVPLPARLVTGGALRIRRKLEGDDLFMRKMTGMAPEAYSAFRAAGDVTERGGQLSDRQVQVLEFLGNTAKNLQESSRDLRAATAGMASKARDPRMGGSPETDK